MWLTGRLTPDFKTIADFRKNNGDAICQVCRQFVQVCRRIGMFSDSSGVAIDGSKFKAVNNRDKNFTNNKLQARIEQLEEGISRYMEELDRADRDPSLVPEARVTNVKEKIAALKGQIEGLTEIDKKLRAAHGNSGAESGSERAIGRFLNYGRIGKPQISPSRARSSNVC